MKAVVTVKAMKVAESRPRRGQEQLQLIAEGEA
jgi:hypothetical protein